MENEQSTVTWIRTAEAAKMLGVKSTQGVLFIVRPDDKWLVRYLNVGTDAKPRYMLAKEDVQRIVNERKNQTNL